ncbi:hypothetical protein Tsubulata_039996 [Turnera subulata]|uniref:Uncharacterized protein n=1 Tax=Turnera subulata TaxID=218843 RepID=A0A9Q0G1R4_9ROSI|nr:hypothetical protein Tsubulata_039996 [Turnera subulata]
MHVWCQNENGMGRWGWNEGSRKPSVPLGFRKRAHDGPSIRPEEANSETKPRHTVFPFAVFYSIYPLHHFYFWEEQEEEKELVEAAMRKETVINVCLVGTFVALCGRSVKQEKDIEALEAQSKSLTLSNKALRNTLWDWKQRLADSASLPLPTLNAIYGDHNPPPPPPFPGDAAKENAESTPPPKLVIS